MKSVTCPACGFVTWATDESCKRCGAILQASLLSSPEMSDVRSTSDFDHSNSGQTGKALHGSQRVESKPKKGLAICSMILGIIAMPPFSLIALGFLLGILIAFFGTTGGIVGGVIFVALLPSGLITGIMSCVRASRRPTQFGGKGFAIAGIALSGFAVITIPLVAAIAIPNLLAARRAANEGTAVSTLRSLVDMQLQYMALNGGRCVDLGTLRWDTPPQGGPPNVKSGYQFAMTRIPMGGCEINALPTEVKGIASTGTRSFYVSSDDGWTIRAEANDGRAATRNSQPLTTSTTQNRGYNDN